jgi:hypothetical protein
LWSFDSFAISSLQHFGSTANLGRASVQDLLPFLPRDQAARLVSSLRLAAVALREERSRLLIDTPLALAKLCAEMRFLSSSSRTMSPFESMTLFYNADLEYWQ